MDSHRIVAYSLAQIVVSAQTVGCWVLAREVVGCWESPPADVVWVVGILVGIVVGIADGIVPLGKPLLRAGERCPRRARVKMGSVTGGVKGGVKGGVMGSALEDTKDSDRWRQLTGGDAAELGPILRLPPHPHHTLRPLPPQAHPPLVGSSEE